MFQNDTIHINQLYTNFLWFPNKTNYIRHIKVILMTISFLKHVINTSIILITIKVSKIHETFYKNINLKVEYFEYILFGIEFDAVFTGMGQSFFF